VKLALSFLFTVRGIPQIYYGTEYGAEGHTDPDNRNDFDWSLFDENYNVKSQYGYEKEIFDHTCKLIQIRKDNEALYCGSFHCLYVDTFLIVYLRFYQDNIVLVAINNGHLDMPESIDIRINANHDVPFVIKKQLANGTFQCLLSGETFQAEEGILTMKIKGKSALVLRKEQL